VEFESGSRLREVYHRAFNDCSIRSVWFPSSLVALDSPCFRSCQLSSLTFESPSHLGTFGLDVGTDFCGSEIEVPSAVCVAEFAIARPGPRPLVVHFDRDSRLCCFKCCSGSGGLATRGAFARFSERTLKYFREMFSYGE
jgi:hypothetical protein